jgi:type IV pilus assembly protein PilC
MTASGAPLLQAIQLAAEQTQSDKLRDVLNEVAGRVSAGSPLHETLAGYGDVFESHWVAMIGTGEASGKMQEVLHNLNDQIRDAQETKRRIVGALVYPIILLVVAVLVVTIMLWFVVPTFGNMFKEMNAELPSITQKVLGASDFVVDYGVYALGVFVVLGFIARRQLRTEAGLRRCKALLIALPVVGDLIVNVSMYRFSSNLGLLLRSGVPMLEALAVLSDVFRKDPAYRDAVLWARDRLTAGRPLTDSLEESGLFTAMMLNAVRIGEQSASLGPVMEEIAPYYKEKTNSFLGKLTKLLEPCIIVGMGGTIAVVMLAIYMPMFEMAGKVN